MLKTLATLTVGVVLALAPTGAAFAGTGPNGNAWGNCQHSSAGGDHDPLPGGSGNGNGGHKKGDSCKPSAPVQTPAETPTDGPVVVIVPGGVLH